MHRGGVVAVVVICPQHAECGFAQPHRTFKHRIEHWSEVARGRVDDLQYLGGGDLLIQCLTRLSQRPRIFHCDNRLRRKTLQQRDLLVRKWPYLLTVDIDHAQHDPFFAQRGGEQGARAADIHQRTTVWVAQFIWFFLF